MSEARATERRGYEKNNSTSTPTMAVPTANVRPRTTHDWAAAEGADEAASCLGLGSAGASLWAGASPLGLASDAGVISSLLSEGGEGFISPITLATLAVRDHVGEPPT